MLSIQIASVLAAATAAMAATFSVSTPFTPCPILGPVFEPPTNLCNSTSFQAVLKNLSSTIDTIVSAAETPFGAIPTNETSFSIGIFDAHETLFSYQHTAQVLQNSSQGVKTVDANSIYRLGSGSKLMTAYLFMIEAGPQYWDHYITQYVPELAAAASNCSANKDAIDCIDWREITLGALASHLGGVPRDC
jgi:CubicO group peptidase (beta-lactamase class C family)